MFLLGWDLLGVRGLKPEQQLTSKTLFDLVKLSFGVVAGAGALVALVVAYRRQRIDEDGALREAARLHTERFTTAVSQLGEESPSVRLGGVHALAGLADDAPTPVLRQTCIDVLCAELRLPYTTESDIPPEDTAARHAFRAGREVRHTIIRLIRDHLRLDADHPRCWQGHDFDLTGVVFDGGDFDDAVFSGGTVSFDGAEFSGGTVSFVRARFCGGTVDFGGAVFSGGTVDFGVAEYSGGRVSFSSARFSGATVRFSGAEFTGGAVHLSGAELSDGMLDFMNAKFTGGTVDLGGSEFSGGICAFVGARFSGGIVDFCKTKFTGAAVSYALGEFTGAQVDFDGAEFTGGMLGFHNSVFTGENVDFVGAHFSGGRVNFQGCSGAVPGGLFPAQGQALPAGLLLAEEWQEANS